MTIEAHDRSAENTPPVGFEEHDHRACVEQTLATAEAYCAAKGLRLTPVRRKVLELLAREHRALGAYAILDLLGDAGFGSQPPVAYRALDFLVEHGFAHKIERLNAFVACNHPDRSHSPAFLICRACGTVDVTIVSDGGLRRPAKAAGFQIEKTVVEAEGLCPTCQDTPS